jgi:hypothetical protein
MQSSVLCALYMLHVFVKAMCAYRCSADLEKDWWCSVLQWRDVDSVPLS